MSDAITHLLAPQGPVVVALRARFPNAMAIYAFGSQVQGTAGPQSDLDLAVLVAGYADPFETYVLSEKTALDEARAPLMADIQRTGKIHGR